MIPRRQMVPKPANSQKQKRDAGGAQTAARGRNVTLCSLRFLLFKSDPRQQTYENREKKLHRSKQRKRRRKTTVHSGHFLCSFMANASAVPKSFRFHRDNHRGGHRGSSG